MGSVMNLAIENPLESLTATQADLGILDRQVHD
jgi:hypothetical protein